MGKLINDRVEKILDELGEAHRDSARVLLREVGITQRVGVAEFLVDAHHKQKLPEAIRRLRPYVFSADGITSSNLVDIYRTMKLASIGAERT